MHTGRILPIAIGTAIILWSFRPGMTFYPGGMGVGSKDRPVPKWLGRLWFIFIGLWPITMGLSNSDRFDPLLSAFFPLAIGVICLGVGAWPHWMPDRSTDGHSHARRGRIIVLLVGLIFFCVGLSELRH